MISNCHPRPMSHLFSVVAVAAFLCVQTPHYEAHAATYNTASIDELADFALEDLAQVKVFSASKQPEEAFVAASAIYVITAKDIHDSGVTSLPEALRLAPGVQVSRVDFNKYAIGIRGFAGRYSNKLLVLQDGRTLYNPLFSGVYWDEQEIVLEDIEQIEVIRGPGATLWGANAVNGVINITTKSAKNTQGGLLVASGGTSDIATGVLRYGVKIGENGYLRVYGKSLYREGEVPVNPEKGMYCYDSRGGFRGDWNLASQNAITVQGDLFDGYSRNVATRGKNLLGRWNKYISDTSDLTLKLYYDQSAAEVHSSNYFERFETADFDLQHTFALGQFQKIVWGTGIRVTHDELNSNIADVDAFNPARKTQRLYSAFVQDNITLLPETLHLIAGSRMEHNDSTGWEFQPTARMIWTPHEQHTLWGAVSRAVRTPSRSDSTMSLLVSPADPPYPEVRLVGNSSIPSEKLIAYEAGYRYQPAKQLSFDLTLFYNDYSSLIGIVSGTPSATLFPLNTSATSTAIGRGGELSVDWRPQSWMNVAMSYSYIDLRVTSTTSLKLAGQDVNRTWMDADTAPRHQVSARSTVELPYKIRCTLWLRYVDELRGPGAPEYVTMDAVIAWKSLPNLELSLAGQNLIEPKHFEYGVDATGNQTAPIARSVYGKVAWTF